MAYHCRRCGYAADVKYTLIRHWNRKQTCSPTKEDISIEQLKNELNNTSIVPSYKCQYCEKEFTDKANMYKHQKKCKKRPSNEDLLQKVQRLESMIEVLLNDRRKEHKQEVHASSIQNVQGNVNNVNTINLTLNNFGSETMANLPASFLTTCFASKDIATLIENIHCDAECPENHNVRIRSRKKQLMEVFKDGRWLAQDEDKTLTELIQNGYRILRSHGRHNKESIMEEENFEESDFNEILNWLETIYEDRNAQKPIKKDIIILFLNNQAMLLGRDRA